MTQPTETLPTFLAQPSKIGHEINHAVGEDALIIHETFRDTRELKLHLAKGTAMRYKKDIYKVATPECCFFRGPVSWTIRTYSKSIRLPATYSSLGTHFALASGSLSDVAIS